MFSIQFICLSSTNVESISITINSMDRSGLLLFLTKNTDITKEEKKIRNVQQERAIRDLVSRFNLVSIYKA